MCATEIDRRALEYPELIVMEDYNLGNFLRRLCLTKIINDWSLRSLQVKLIKMGGRIVRHTWKIIFQVAEVVVPRDLFAAILKRITRLCLSSG